MTTVRIPARIHSVRLVDIEAPPGRATGLATATPGVRATGCVLLTPTLPHRVLYGHATLWRARAAGSGHVEAIVADLEVDSALSLAAEAGDAVARSALASALYAGGLRGAALGRLLGLDKAELTRVRQLALPSPARDALLAGHITRGHARLLLPLARAEQTVWLARVRKERWSVARLAAERRGATAAGDTTFTRTLAERLGAPVELRWGEGHGELRIGWTKLAALQGIFERLGRGDATETTGLPERPRTLVIRLDSLDELDAIAAPLLGD